MRDAEARRLAIHDPERDLCLSAGAGSGKTTVLVDRLIHLLGQGHAELYQIAAITFTEKAAAELKTRLSAALRRDMDDPACGRRLWQYDLGGAYIGTIHGFCGALLRENAVEAGIDPGFGVLDEPGREALFRRSFEAWMDEMLGGAQRREGLLSPLLERMDLRCAREILRDLMGKPLQLRTLLERYLRRGEDPGESPEHAAVRKALMAAAGDLSLRWRAAQDAQGVMDFDALLERALELLRERPEVRVHYQRQFRYIHIDEFQDIDGVQAELVRLLCGFEGNRVKDPPRLFVVGDPQQSIYRFRGADVDQFARMEQAIVQRQGLSLRLSRCFRSQAALVGFFNHSFEQLFFSAEAEPAEKGMRYMAVEAVRPADPAGPAVEFLLCATGENAARSRALEADALARRLRQMLDEGKLRLGEEGRALRPGDIALLFRAMSDVRIYQQALRRYGIPSYTVAGSGFFARQEVLDLLNLLRLLLRPHDRLALTAVLRAPWAGCSDATLFWIALEDAWDDLRSPGLRRRIGVAEGRLLDGFLECFEDLRPRRDRLPVAGLIAEFLHRTLYQAVLAVQPEGRQALGNLRKLIDLARRFDSGPASSLRDFLSYLEERLAHTPHEPEAALELERGDTVKLMSIHQAKGLEWPVVAVADLARAFQLPGGKPLLWDPSVGMGLKLRDEKLDMKPSPEYERVRGRLERLDLAEQQRVLYVAATRARDRLLLSGSYRPEKFEPGLESARSWLEWIGAIYPLGKEAPTYPVRGEEMPVRVEEPPHLESRTREGEGTYPELVACIRDTLSKAEPDPKSWRAQLSPPAPGTPASRIAVTELELFSVCARRYQLCHLLQLPEESDPSEGFREEGEAFQRAPALSVGRIVHQVLNILPPDAAGENLRPLVRQQVRQQNPEEAEGGAQAERAALRLLERWLHTPRWAQVRQSLERRGEVPFVLRLAGGRRLAGRFDALYRDAEDRWHVLDYKTDRIEGPASAHLKTYYRLQQQAYGLAAARLLGEELEEVVFNFLRTGEEVVWRPSPAAVEEAQSHLGAVAATWEAALRSQRFSKTEDTRYCIRCGFRALCGR